VKAARYYGQGDIRVDDIPEPTPGPGQVQVAVDWCGICGSDLHEFLEGPIFIPPQGSPHPITGAELPAVVMGHEFAGVVSGVGAGVSFLDGLFRFDVARGVYPRKQFRVDLSLESKF